MRWLLALAIAACGAKPIEQSPDLATYLGEVRASIRIGDEIAGWKLDEAEWKATVVDPYDRLYAEYAAEFDRVWAPRLTGQFEHARQSAVEVRKHYADGSISGDELRARWALPVLADTKLATLGGVTLSTVFVWIGGRWKAIVGLQSILTRRIERLDASCAAQIERPDGKPCRDIAWEVADAALRNQRDRLDHACTLARTACGKPSP